MSRIVVPEVRSALGKLAEKHAYFSRKVDDVRCPHCGKSYEIVPSRRELSEPVARFFFFFYHCRICEHRFRLPRSWLRYAVTASAGVSLTLLTWIAIRWLA